MKVRGVWVMLAVLVAVGFFAARAWAPSEGAASEKPKGEAAQAKGEKAEAKGEQAEAKRAEGEMMMCPCCGGMMKPGEGARGMTGPMRMHHRMMMNERLSAKDPSSMLGLREELKLTEKQVKQLEKIETKARTDAQKVLTKEQRETLSEVPEHGAWMRQMRERMTERHTGGAAKEGTALKEGEAEKHEH